MPFSLSIRRYDIADSLKNVLQAFCHSCALASASSETLGSVIGVGVNGSALSVFGGNVNVVCVV